MNLKVGKNRRVKAANIYDKRKTLPTLSCLLWRTKMIRSQSGKRSFNPPSGGFVEPFGYTSRGSWIVGVSFIFKWRLAILRGLLNHRFLTHQLSHCLVIWNSIILHHSQIILWSSVDLLFNCPSESIWLTAVVWILVGNCLKTIQKFLKRRIATFKNTIESAKRSYGGWN